MQGEEGEEGEEGKEEEGEDTKKLSLANQSEPDLLW